MKRSTWHGQHVHALPAAEIFRTDGGAARRCGCVSIWFGAGAAGRNPGTGHRAIAGRPARSEPGDTILLIVEDDPHYARVLIDLARDKGFKVLVAARGTEALELAKQYQPAAVSLDVFLPDMLGWTVLSQLKHNPLTRHIPVQIITLDEDRQHALARGAFSFVNKPTTTEGVSAALSQIKEYTKPRRKRLLIVEDNEAEQLSIRELAHRYRLSLRGDTAKYVTDNEMWDGGEQALADVLGQRGMPYDPVAGEGAFYGPIDVQIVDQAGRESTLSTVQLDFYQPGQFDLCYVAADQSRHRPVMIHRSIVGSLERLVAHLTEVHAGAFPAWMAPVQVVVLPVAARSCPQRSRCCAVSSGPDYEPRSTDPIAAAWAPGSGPIASCPTRPSSVPGRSAATPSRCAIAAGRPWISSRPGRQPS